MATKTVKAANYTAEMEARIREVGGQMKGAAAAKLLAGEFGKSVPSLRAKMAQMGCYEKDEVVATASTRTKKSELVAAIVAAGVPLNEAEAEGLEKSTASALSKVLARLTNG